MPIEALSDSLVNAFVQDGSLPGLEAAIEEYGKLSEQQESEEELQAALAMEQRAQVPAPDPRGAPVGDATFRGRAQKAAVKRPRSEGVRS